MSEEICAKLLTVPPTAVERLIFICNNIFLRKRKDLRSARTRTSSLFLYKTASNKKASPWGEVPSLSRRRGVMTIKRKNCSPLSVALTGASSPQGGAFLSIYRKR